LIYVEAFARTYYNSMDTRKANYQYPSEEYLGNISMDKSPLMLFYKKSDPGGHGHLSMEMKSLILKLDKLVSQTPFTQLPYAYANNCEKKELKNFPIGAIPSQNVL